MAVVHSSRERSVILKIIAETFDPLLCAWPTCFAIVAMLTYFATCQSIVFLKWNAAICLADTFEKGRLCRPEVSFLCWDAFLLRELLSQGNTSIESTKKIGVRSSYNFL